MRIPVILSLLALTMVPCGGAAGVHPQVPQGWRLTEDLRIGPSGDGPTSFATIRALEVDRAGRIYVLENQPQDVRVFEPDGRFLRHIGRTGAGPGEYQNASAFAWDSLGRLLVVDEQNARNSFFDSTGRFVESRVRPVSGFYGWNWGGAILNDGRTIEALMIRGPNDTRASAYGLVDAQGRIRDTLVLPASEGQAGPPATWRLARGSRTVFMNAPFSPRGVAVLDARGYVWTARTDRYRIVQFGLGGDTIRVIERRVVPQRVTRRDIDSVVGAATRQFGAGPDIDRSLIPSTKPLFSTLTVDDVGRLWVRVPPAEGTQGTAFDVFDAQGRYLGVATTPLVLGLNIVVRRGAMYAAATTEDDEPFVVRLRIERARR